METLSHYNRQKLIEMGLIIESENPAENMDSSPETELLAGDEDQFPDADYEMQDEIIRFFVNNPGADPETFREYSISLGADPDEMQRQQNILLSQLLSIYVQDSEDLGYGNALTNDEVPQEVRDMVTQQDGGM